MAEVAGLTTTQIQCAATVYKVQTLMDGGLRVTLDLPETAIAEAAQLMECKRQEVVLNVRFEREQKGMGTKSGRTR